MADQVKSIVPNKAGYPEFPASPAVEKATGVSVDPGTLVGKPVNSNPGTVAETVVPHPDDVANNPHPSTIVPVRVVEPMVEPIVSFDALQEKDTVRMGSVDPMVNKTVLKSSADSKKE